jgi:hypothetical protein
MSVAAPNQQTKAKEVNPAAMTVETASVNAMIQSEVSDSIMYITVEQKVPGIICVKSIPVLKKVMLDGARAQKKRIVSLQMLGEPVIINREICYPAAIVVLVP